MNAKKAQLVLDGEVLVLDLSTADLFAALEVRGFEFTGRLHNNPKTRSEMQGAPIFKGLAGPMYGGPDTVRYESARMNELLSR